MSEPGGAGGAPHWHAARVGESPRRDAISVEDVPTQIAASAGSRRRRAGAVPLRPFDRVVDEHGPAVLRFCVSRAGAAGEDVFQDTMIAGMRGYPELRDPGAVRGWLFSIAHRKTIDAARAAARTPRPGGTPEELEVGGAGIGGGSRSGSAAGATLSGAGGGSATGGRPVAETAIERADGGPWEAVRELPPKQREAVTLRYLGDLTNAEVASIMGTSEEAARRNVFEGLKRLRALVERG